MTNTRSLPAGPAPWTRRTRSGLRASLPLLAVAALAAWVGTASSFGQAAPKLTSVTPEWIQRGTTVTVTLVGENLGSVSSFLFEGEPGLSATNVPPPPAPQPTLTIVSSGGSISRAEVSGQKNDKELVIKLTVSGEASLAPRDLRVISPQGISNPIQLNVGSLPEVAEAEPNDRADQAQSLALPATIHGVIGSQGDADWFKFKASQAEDLTFDVESSRRGSELDSTLILHDAAGHELARSEDANGLDSLIHFHVPADGEYLLELRDYRYQGGGNFKYRLHAGAIPYVENVFPLGGQRGKTVEIALTGHNLDGTGRLTLNVDAQAPRGRQDIRARTTKGFSNPIPFDVQDAPDAFETEPNDTREKANAVSLPVVVNGKIGSAKDVDYFKFKAERDQKIICEVAAARFGSRLDPLLVLMDAQGGVLAQNDDAVQQDARIEFDAKKDTEYTIAVRDLTERGGERFGYRLAVRPPSGGGSGAGFTPRFLPDAVRVSREGQTRLRCEVVRSGYEGPVRFTFDKLPSGVHADPLVLPAGPASGILILTASKEAALGTSPIQLSATAMIDGKQVTRTAEPLLGDRVVRQAFVTVLPEAPFQLDALTLSATAEQNQSVQLEALATRREGFAGEIKLTTEGFAAGREAISKNFSGGDGVIKATEPIGRVALTPKLDSEVGLRTVVIRGEAMIDGHSVSQYTAPIPVGVTQLPFTVSSTLARLSVTALPPEAASAASETATTIRVERRAGFAGEITLTLDGLPSGVNVTAEKMAPSVSETSVKLVATDKVKAGTNYTFTVVGSGMYNEKTYRYRSGAITLNVSAPEPAERATPQTAAATAPAAAGSK